MSLSLSNVTLTFPDGRGRLTALDHVDLDVGNGSFVAVTGPSGSGKSSLLSVAGTLLTPDSGTVEIDGTPTTALSDEQRARIRRDRIGFVFQQDNLLPSLTALDQLLLTVDLGGQKPVRHRDEALALLDEVGVAGAASRRPHELSGGMRQRVNIARALTGSPALLLIDEPTSALDTERGRAVIELIGTLVRQRDVAAVLVSHDLDSMSVAPGRGVDRVLHMRDGHFESAARTSPAPA
ncbi:ABC transporter ATP-binding protein [Gordonia insulae]|uniref:Lipoprotein-releasing system ATP-binding protein LolD n=1 Tax=Gordonia insulae TaxID=2420509 RepID=A0A3G8JNS6_9ACTN|nr:ABC transporter ATP-binding protein [Gordonia insulae]AZG46162.1 Lipoprotein-releasing system ATP-binding protein LolD [Gordonia insulae]